MRWSPVMLLLLLPSLARAWPVGGARLTGAFDFLTGVTNPNDESYTFNPETDGLLRSFTDPRQHPHSYTYEDGRLKTSTEPDLAVSTFDLPVETGVNREVKRTTGEGRVTRFVVQQLLDGARRRFVHYPDGTSPSSVDSMATASPYGQVLVSRAPQVPLTTTRTARDGRFGWLAPIDSQTVTTLPSGLARTDAFTRSLSGSIYNETSRVNADGFTSDYNVTTRQLTTLSPESRSTTTTLDATGRPILLQSPGRADVSMQYDAQGRLFLLKQADRMWTYSYDANGRLAVARDSSSHLMTRYFDYDLADRLLSQELPGGRIVNYSWDANGNMTSLVPPGRPAHGFAYDAVDLNSQYVAPPPAPGQPASTTVYEYDLEKNLKRVTRPGDAQVVITRDPDIGRVTTLTHPHGVNRYAYWTTAQPAPGATQATGQLKSITRESTPDTVAVSFNYDGPLLTAETWSGAVAGRVEHAYDNAFRERLERVQVGAAPAESSGYAYDHDGFLVRVGPMRIVRRASDAQVQSTTVGQVSSTATYDAQHAELTDLDYTVGGSVLYHEHLDRDPQGRVTRVDETWSGVTTTRQYRYDDAGRLSQVLDAAGAQLRAFEYDHGQPGNGNRTTIHGPSTAMVIMTAEYDEQDRMTNLGDATYSWQAAGELAQRNRPNEQFIANPSARHST